MYHLPRPFSMDQPREGPTSGEKEREMVVDVSKKVQGGSKPVVGDPDEVACPSLVEVLM